MQPKWLLDAIVRFNSSIFNHLTLTFAGHRERPYSVVRHSGHRSGEEYGTPVVAEQRLLIAVQRFEAYEEVLIESAAR
jgi:hypothetical protein